MSTKIKVLEEKLPKKSCSYCKHLSLEGPNKDFTYDIKCIMTDLTPVNGDLCENFDPENTKLNSNDLDNLYMKFLESTIQVDYCTYLNSIHWKLFRERALNHYNFECSNCGCSDSLEVYHLNDNFGRESYDDVDVLCQNCLNK